MNALEDEFQPKNLRLKKRKSMFSKASKNDSGVKFRSGASTLDSFKQYEFEQHDLDDPIIIDETPKPQSFLFDQYMLGKDQAHLESLHLDMIDSGDFKALLQTQWQTIPPQFFKMTTSSQDASANHYDDLIVQLENSFT